MSRRGLVITVGTLAFLGALAGLTSKLSKHYNYKKRVELGLSVMLGGRTFLDDIDGDGGVDSIIDQSYYYIEFYDPKKEDLVRKTGIDMSKAISLSSETLSLANDYFNGRNVESELKYKLNMLREASHD